MSDELDRLVAKLAHLRGQLSIAVESYDRSPDGIEHSEARKAVGRIEDEIHVVEDELDKLIV